MIEVQHHIEQAAVECGVPRHLIGGIVRYVLHGIQPGGFLTAVFSNDLKGAIARADEGSYAGLRGIVVFMHSAVPAGCQGSEEAFRKWTEIGGLHGLVATQKRQDAEDEA